MKLAGAKANAFFAKPDKSIAAVLIYGADAMRVALKRQELIGNLIGEKGEEEMRLTRMTAGELRKEPALVLDGLKAQGFFPGARAVLVEEANDTLAAVLTTALGEWAEGDATLVVTAGQLNARAKLRKLFEGDARSVAIGIYADPPGKDEIARDLEKAGLKNVPNAALEDLFTLGRELEPGDFKQTLEKLAIYMHGVDAPVTAEDIAACAPTTSDAALDDAIHIVAEAKHGEVGPMIRRLSGQGVNPTSLCIAALRHFRTLHAAASNKAGPDVALSRARPPVFGPRKDRMARQARGWGSARLERAIEELMATDLTLRSSAPVPQMPLVERAFIRIAMMRPK